MYIGGWSLIGAKFPNAIWWQVDAGNANLTGIDLSGTDARLANFANANLTGANLSNMNLSGANFAGANLTNANLSGSNFTATNFQDANMTGAIAPGATVDHTLICGAFDTTQDGFETDRALMYINDYGGLSTDDQFGEGCSFTQMWQNAFSNSSEAASTSLEIADLLAELLHVLL